MILSCSEEEAKKKIYSVCTSTYTGFGALISEELSYKVKGWISVGLILANVLLYPEVLTEFNFFLMLPSLLEGLPGVLWVLPDSYLDVPNKDYGGRYLLFLPWVKFHWSVWIQPDHNSLWFYFVAQYSSYKRGVSLVPLSILYGLVFACTETTFATWQVIYS